MKHRQKGQFDVKFYFMPTQLEKHPKTVNRKLNITKWATGNYKLWFSTSGHSVCFVKSVVVSGPGFLSHGLELSQKMRHTAPGNKQEGLCVTFKVCNMLPSRMWASRTYKNPFPQPNGPKNSSVGRQTFLHTPLKLGQDHGKDAASFSTTAVPNQCTFTKLKTFSFGQNALWLTIEQQDKQERQHNQAIASHSWDWMRCWLGGADLIREDGWR